MEKGTDSLAGAESQQAGWKQIFTGKLGVYSLIVNLGVGLFAIDTFVISTIMPTVVGDIGGTEFYSWSVMLFMVGSIMGAAGAAPVRDRLGRRNGYVLAGLVFLIGNMAAALAPNMLVLVFWRFVQGLGGGLIISQSYGLVGDVYPQAMRPRILSIISSTWGIATVIGPGFGGIFAELGLWRGAFWVLVPLAGLFTFLAWRSIPGSETEETKSRFPLFRLFAMGGGMLCVGFTSQVEDNLLRGALIIAAVFLVVMGFRRDAQSERPMFPAKTLVITSEIGAAYWVMLLITVSFTIAILYTTFYLQIIHKQPPLVSAYINAIMSFCWTTSAIVVAGFKGRWIWGSIIGGGGLLVAGAAVLLTQATTGHVVFVGIGLALIGLGMGLTNNHVIALAILAAPKGGEALAGSSVQTMRNLGLGFGAAAAGLFANAAGITSAGVELSATGHVSASNPSMVVYAINWVHGADLGAALLTLLVILYYFGKAKHRTAPVSD
jgi:MFS family permease